MDFFFIFHFSFGSRAPLLDGDILLDLKLKNCDCEMVAQRWQFSDDIPTSPRLKIWLAAPPTHRRHRPPLSTRRGAGGISRKQKNNCVRRRGSFARMEPSSAK
jgi:hypothetical protein